MNNIKEMFSNLEESIVNRMNIKIEHNLEDGKYREELIRDFLKNIIPSKYSITNGFIIDSDKNMSDEMDIIIYDTNYVPPFFKETYSVIPIESVIAVIQVKTTLSKKELAKAVTNLNSIDRLNSKVGGSIISASGLVLEESRYIKPYKILVTNKSSLAKKYNFEEELKSIDMIYIMADENKKRLLIKNKSTNAIVNQNLDNLIEAQNNYEVKEVKKDLLANFTLMLLDKMKLINNSIIINYKEYLKGVNEDE